MQTINPGVQRFIERFGRYLETLGASHSSGQVLAFLLISEKPQSLDDMVEALQISKASASLGTRVWEQTNLIERVHVRGDRKVYYQVAPDISVSLASAALQKFEAIATIAEEGLAALEQDQPNANVKLREFARVYRRLHQQVPKLFADIMAGADEE